MKQPIKSCPNCGHPIESNQNNCTSCGVTFNETPTQTITTQVKPPMTKKKKMIIISIIALSVILLGVIIGLIIYDNTPVVGGSSSSSGGSSGRPLESASRVLVISNVKMDHGYNYTTVTGTIKNTGDYTAFRFVKVRVSLLDYRGNVIETDWTYAVGQEGINPGESKSFSCMIPYNSKVQKCEVELMN